MEIGITLFIQGLAFFAVAWLVMKYGWPLINAAIEERQKKIADGLAAAEQGKKALSEAQAKETEVIREARGKAAEILDRAHHQANQIVDQAKMEAGAEKTRLMAAAEAEVANLTHQAKGQLRTQVADLAVKGAERLIGKEISSSTHRQLLDQLIAEI
jgi:F-type H+-transporting ATPase subunit b